MRVSGRQPKEWIALLRTRSADAMVEWRTRQSLAEETAHWLLTHPDDEAARELLLLLASDQRWEVRRAVARAMANLPEPIFSVLLQILSNDENDFVSGALKRVIQRREPKPARANRSRHRGLQQQLKEIETTFGSAASRMASQLADRMSNELLRTVAHDLKTILTPIKLSLSEIAEQSAANADIQASLARLKRSFQDLESLTRAINVFSRPIELELHTENVSDLIAEAVETARNHLREHGRDISPVQIAIYSIPDVRARISRPHILLTLTNLIQNAIEANAERTGFRPGTVSITVTREESSLRIVVADTGSGIPRSDLMKLKEYVPGHSSKATGTGYGLPIAKRYIEAHHGTLQLSSEEGIGTTVAIQLPLNSGEH